MPVTLYSFKFRRELPLLSEEEFQPIAKLLRNRVEDIKQYRTEHGAALDEARRHSSNDALDYYEKLTGIRLSHPDELYWVRLSRYGRGCPKCGKPFRTPRAKLCAECGLELREGEVAGPRL